MNAYEPAVAYHRSVRLLYQIIDNYNKHKYETLVINMVKSGNYHYIFLFLFFQCNMEPFCILSNG